MIIWILFLKALFFCDIYGRKIIKSIAFFRNIEQKEILKLKTDEIMIIASSK